MYVYYLPNRCRIDVERVVDVMLAEAEYPQWYLDTDNGILVEISSPEALGKWVSEIGKSRRYFLIERFDDETRNNIARAFIKEILVNMATPAETAGTLKALLSGGWQSMRDYLKEYTDGWIHAWDQFLFDEAWESIHEWLTTSPYFFVTAEFEGCSNCTLCELVKRGEDGDFSKLKGAFEAENIMHHIAVQMGDIANKTKVKLKDTRQQNYPNKQVLQLKIELIGSKPPIWRRILVPANYTFFALHVAIQDAMGWFDYHLHQFSNSSPYIRGKKRQYIKLPHPDDNFAFDDSTEHLDELTTPVVDFLEKEKDAVWYEYDFGDGWIHKVTLEKILPDKEALTLPKIVAGKNRCPFEDSGALFGYYEKIQILKNKKLPEYEDILGWVAEQDGYDVDDVD